MNGNDFISLTDIAKYKNADYPSEIIQNWMRNRGTLIPQIRGNWTMSTRTKAPKLANSPLLAGWQRS